MSKTALLLVDIQNDYFQSGKWPLPGMESASGKAAELLTAFRENDMTVVHVRHENPAPDAPFFRPGSPGARIHSSLAPLDHEPVVTKQHANSFRDTDLQEILDQSGVESLIIAGAMSNMCIDAVTRAAADLGYQCSVAHDACAAMDLGLGDTLVPADQVHAAFMAALSLGYANVASSDVLLGGLDLA